MIKKLSLVCLFVLLTACQHDYHYHYLMTHPTAIKEALSRCQASENKTEAQSPECEIVAKAATDIETLIEAEQQDPEQFGQDILTLQANLANGQMAFEAAKSNYTRMQAQQADTAELETAKADLNAAKLAYRKINRDIAFRQAVLSLGTPD